MERELKLKSGIVKRLGKELKSYEEESVKQTARIEKLVQSNADEHDVKKQKEVLDETTQILPDTKRRLTEAVGQLQQVVDNYTKNGSSSNEDLINANELLQMYSAMK
ncbi:hypothetical protein HK101_010452 [Irineochytrium annulatum]|nr:hypothetical protein HK101_010452 [Irineochytrium annulatum]